VERNAFVGQVIDPTSTMLRVADLSMVLVVLEVFERDIARVSVGDHAEIRAETHPGRTFIGTVAAVESTVRAETRTARVRIAVQTPDEALRPGQFVTARLRLREVARDALTVARSAVILIEGQPTVFVALDDDSFEPRTVGTLAVDGDRVEISRGIHAGERVAVDGVFALKSELQR
jgi:RND family efflux transporter MFP subunit